jgi:valyl-tRNA synthetase
MAFACVFSVVLPYTPTVSAEESLEDLRNQYEDLEKEILKNQQALDKVESEIKRAEGKLSNQGFVAKAPKALIDGEKAKLQKFTEIRDKILASIKEFEG